MRIKRFNESEMVDEWWKEDKERLTDKIDNLIKYYEEFTKLISPQWWRVSGSHLTDLRKMREDIDRFDMMSKTQREEAEHNGWL
jgi:hypothetical protein